MSKEKVISA